jgi:CheY-like chemotaxis protein
MGGNGVGSKHTVPGGALSNAQVSLDQPRIHKSFLTKASSRVFRPFYERVLHHTIHMHKRDRLTCLVVDDEEPIRACVCDVLESHQFDTVTASNVIDALRLLKAVGDSIDLIVSDIEMPGGDGVTLARAARELFPALPVVLMSGHQVFNIIKYLNATFQFVRKPFTSSELLTSVQEATGRQPGMTSMQFDKAPVGLESERSSLTPIWRVAA